jgi:glycosyltransferase involved in cell wall biosynthesis/tetratricopeptide (TPR) repeat protein
VALHEMLGARNVPEREACRDLALPDILEGARLAVESASSAVFGDDEAAGCTVKIAACLICRNSVGTIEKALETIRPFVDEINVFDTGSTDGTVALLRQLNRKKVTTIEDMQGNKAKVALAPIRVKVGKKVPLAADGLLADFSWAREQSFAMASEDADWFFWLDDDDLIIGAEHLRPMAMQAHQALDGFVMFYDYARDPQTGTNVCALWRERLLRRKSPDEWGWRNAVHEVWIPHEETGLAPNYMMVPAHQIRFIHDRPEGRYANTRNLAILTGVVAEAEAKGEEPDPRTLAYMGTELMAQGRFDEAIPWLNRYLEHPGAVVGDERSQTYHKLATCMRALNQPAAAIHVEQSALKERDDWAENAVGLCEAFAEMGEWKRCEKWARDALAMGQPQSMLILNPLEFTLIPRLRLAQALCEQRRFDEAAPLVSEAAQIMPQHPMVLETATRVERDGHRERIVQAVLTLRETLVRWDENWKAHELLQQVPYIVGDDPRIVAAQAMQTENVMHALEPAEYTRWYEDEPKEMGCPDEFVEATGDRYERAGFLLELAQRFEEEHGRKPRMLDLGCNDAWMGAYMWLKGEFVCDGIELNKDAALHAGERMVRMGIPARIVQGDIHEAVRLLDPDVFGDYDIVSCFEVFEHVPDTSRLLSVMESLLTPEGVACVTTPNGAFEDGNLAMWQIVERKGHLRAVTALDLAEQLADRNANIDQIKVHDHNRLTFAAWKPGRKKKGKVILYAPGAYEQWSPASINDGGIGGSETCLTYLALGLTARDWDVRVYADAVPGAIGNTIWRPSSRFRPTEEADAVIVSRAPHAFDVDIHAPVRALWCHDATYADQLTPRRAQRITDMITLSEWSRDAFKEQYPFLTDEQLRIIRNGVSLESMAGEPKFPRGNAGFDERKPVCIYSSSADRGLDVLLEWWPQIKTLVPEAELHVYYGWETLDKMARFRPELLQFKAKVFELIARAGGEAGGVHMKGRVGQTALYEAMQEARVWSYPTYFTETSCIGAMEARSAGLAVVTSRLAALSETVGGHGLLLDVDEQGRPTAAYGERFVGLVAQLLSNEAHWTRWHEKARDGIEGCSWERRLDDWEALITGSRESAPVGDLVAA